MGIIESANCPNCGYSVKPEKEWFVCPSCQSHLRYTESSGSAYLELGKVIGDRIQVTSRRLIDEIRVQGQETRAELRYQKNQDTAEQNRTADSHLLIGLRNERVQLERELTELNARNNSSLHSYQRQKVIKEEIEKITQQIHTLEKRLDLRTEETSAKSSKRESGNGWIIAIIIFVVILVLSECSAGNTPLSLLLFISCL